MTILDVHNVILDILKRERGEFASHAQIDRLLHVNQLTLFSELIGNYRQYQAGRPVPLVTYGSTQRTLDDLNPFKKTINFISTPYHPNLDPYGVTEGVLVLPEDYLMLIAAHSVVLDNGATRERPVHIVDDEQWASRTDSSIVQPTKIDPIARMHGIGGTVNGIDIGTKRKILFSPKDLSGHLSYFYIPPKPVYVFTLSGRVETFDAANSVDMLWSDHVMVLIIRKTLEDLGVIAEDVAVINKMTEREMASA